MRAATRGILLLSFLATATHAHGLLVQPSITIDNHQTVNHMSVFTDLQVFSLKSIFGSKEPPLAPAVPKEYKKSNRTCYVEAGKSLARYTLSQDEFYIATKHYGKVKSADLTSSSIITSVDNTQTNLPLLMDTREIDATLEGLNGKLFNYPIASMTGYAKYQAEETLTKVIAQLTPYAKSPDASIYILYRTALAHHYARNLDLGLSHQLLELDYINRALKLDPNYPDLNYLYGTMIADSGGLNEAIPYFNTAISYGHKLGYVAKANTYKLLNLPVENVQGCLYEYYLQAPYDAKTQDFQRRLERNDEYLWRDTLPP